MKKPTCEIFPEGGIIRMKNKRISFKVTEGKTMINFQMVDTDADVPACSHKCIRGKVRETFVQMSNEAMDALVFSYMKHKNFLKNEMINDSEFQSWKMTVNDNNKKEDSLLYEEYLKEYLKQKKQNETKPLQKTT